MKYKEFNKLVFEFYTRRSNSTFCNLSIDRHEIETILDIKQIKNFYSLRYPWNSLLIIQDDIPQYFGLLAIQCFAASLMHDDGIYGENAYIGRLKETLGLEEDSEVQNLFRGNNPTNPVQEQIWLSAQKYFKKELNQDLIIPSRTLYAHRYVKYPKSQALLNIEDLKHFTVFFAKEFKAGEIIPYSYFEQRLRSCWHKIKITKRAKSILEDIDKTESCKKQIFEFYNLWDGTVETKYLNNSYFTYSSTKGLGNIFNIKLLLLFEENTPKFYTTDYNYNSPVEIEIKNIFNDINYKSIHENIILFTQLEYYDNEYEESRFLYPNSTAYILLNKEQRLNEYRYLENNNYNYTNISKDITLYTLQIAGDNNNDLLTKYFNKINPTTLIGGLKINRKKEYLIRYGPSISSKSNFIVIKDNLKQDYNSELSEIGSYIIRTNNFKDIEFKIIELPKSNGLVKSNNLGWNMKDYAISNIYDIEGCLIMENHQEINNPIRDWINVVMSIKYNGRNILLKAVNKGLQ